jgi:hypothetical protein
MRNNGPQTWICLAIPQLLSDEYTTKKAEEVYIMEIKFNVTGTKRKACRNDGALLGWAPVYKGAPSFAYAVANVIIDKDGTLSSMIVPTRTLSESFLKVSTPPALYPRTLKQGCPAMSERSWRSSAGAS